jgi:hypothetical protein
MGDKVFRYRCEVCGKKVRHRLRASDGPWRAFCVPCGDALIDNLEVDGGDPPVEVDMHGVMTNVLDVDVRSQVTDLKDVVPWEGDDG